MPHCFSTYYTMTTIPVKIGFLLTWISLSLISIGTTLSLNHAVHAGTDELSPWINFAATPGDALRPIATPTPSITPKPSIAAINSISDWTNLFIPLLSKALPTPTAPPDTSMYSILYCNSHASVIPDNDAEGISSNILSDDNRYIHELEVRLDISHTWLGDLNATLAHAETGTQINLLERPGIPASSSGCDQDDIVAILDDDVTLPIEDRCTANSPSISGIYKPDQSLVTFFGEGLAGTWTLTVSDNFREDTGRLNEWCLAARVSEAPSSPTPPPSVGSLPSHAQISAISGRSQALPLDCESRSAVDWAAYFGVKIDEIEFFNNLPESDNPDLGFVGNVYGAWGQIPPHPYGVHAEPVAETLSDYGLEAYAHRPLSWDGLRSEIAAGRPVIVWIVGNSAYQYVVNGIPVYYSPSQGDLTVVARYEHTVVVTGYTSDSVSYLNGGSIYTKSLNQFLESWSVMRNMAVTARP